MSFAGGAAGCAYACCCGGYAGCAYSCSYACWSWAAQRPACRRDTRFDTAVAVPAMTAVRATPRMSPGIGFFLLVGSVPVRGDFRGVEGGEYRLHRDALAGDQLRTAAPKRRHQRGRPPVLVDDQAGCAARPDGLRRGVDVVLVEEPG